MDARRFDELARALTEAGTRRGLLGLLATVPVLGGLFALLDLDETEAKGRRKRRKKRHKHGKGRDKGKHHKKHKPKKCKPASKTTTCAGKCGSVKNNCKKSVDCGPCDCDPPCGACVTCSGAFVCEPCEPCCDDVCCAQASAICHADTGACCVPDSHAQTCDGQCGEVTNNCGVPVDCGSCTCGGGCPACQVCDEQTNDCIPDPNQQGDDCGEAGQVCESDGRCSCEANSCPACTTCAGNGFCQGCADCCDGNGNCQDGTTNATCGSSGSCDVCTGQEQCQDQSCVCVPACTGKVCGPDGCGEQCGPGCDACETCLGDGTCTDPCSGSGCCAGTTCEQGDSNSACGRNGEACVPCTGADTCGGGNPGTPGVCGCTPTTCATQGKNCGSVADGCGDTLDCGDCSLPETCGGGGTANVCGCTATTCAAEGKNCGTIDDSCGGTLTCGSCDPNGTAPLCLGNVCTACTGNGQCQDAGLGGQCCGGACCADPDAVCDNTDTCCVPESVAETCGTQLCGTAINNCGQEVACTGCTGCCDGNTCRGPSERTNSACAGTDGAACSNCLSSNSLCRSGTCQACDVCPSGECDFTSVQAAVNASSPQLSTILICPGKYEENASTSDAVRITRGLSLIGAGDGADDTSNTILRPQVADRNVVLVFSSSGNPTTVALEGLRLTGGSGSFGRGLNVDGVTLALTNCTITENHPTSLGTFGAGARLVDVQATLTNTNITFNTTPGFGGGMWAAAGTQITLDTLSRVTNNEADTTANSGGGILAQNSSTVDLPSVANVTDNDPNDCLTMSGATFTGVGAVCTST